MRQACTCASVLLALAMLGSCGPTIRRTGQVEMFTIDSVNGGEGRLVRPRRSFTDERVSFQQARVGPDAHVDPRIGDLVRFTSDSVTITVPGIYLDHLPSTFSSVTTNRYDAILFAEVWENAAVDRSQPSINRIVHIAMDQRVPSRLNFQDAIAYGPTTFKGHPIRIKFTLILLQRRAKETAETAAKSLQDFISIAGAGTPVGSTASTVVALIRQVMRSLPDVEAFDFEATLLPFRPPQAAQWDGSLARRRLSAEIAALSQRPSDIASANRLGARLAEAAASLEADRVREIRDPAERAVSAAASAADGPSARDAALRALNALVTEGLPSQHVVKINKEIASLRGLQSTESVALALSVSTAVLESVDAALADRAEAGPSEFLQFATALAAAQDQPAVEAALGRLRNARDHDLIVSRTVDTSEVEQAVNARPWLRYCTYAMVETARYRQSTSEPIEYIVDGAEFAAERVRARTGADASLPNWMLMDIVPGLQPIDDRIFQVTSDAANRLLVSSGFTRTGRMLEDPGVLLKHFDAIRDDALLTLVSSRGEMLAMRIAREASENGESPADQFTEQGPFVNKFNSEIGAALTAVNVGTQIAEIRERIRRQFAVRFAG